MSLYEAFHLTVGGGIAIVLSWSRRRIVLIVKIKTTEPLHCKWSVDEASEVVQQNSQIISVTGAWAWLELDDVQLGSLVYVCKPACWTWGPLCEVQLTVQIKLKKETLPELSFFLGFVMSLCPKSCQRLSVWSPSCLMVCFVFDRFPYLVTAPSLMCQSNATCCCFVTSAEGCIHYR